MRGVLNCDKNALVVFYSRTGNTRKVALALADGLKCGVDEIVDTKDRDGLVGYVLAGKDATLKTPAKIKEAGKDPAAYGLVVIGTPVWAWTVSAPVRAYLLRNRDRFRQVAFFCTHGGSGSRTFTEMEAVCGKKPVAVLGISEKELVDGTIAGRINGFVNLLRTA